MPRHHSRQPSLLALALVFAAGAIAATCISRRDAHGAMRRHRESEGHRAATGMAAISPEAAEGADPDPQFVRPAGPSAMRDAPQRDWDETDEASDESFPASDPPGNY